MVILQSASKWHKMLDTNMSVCNTEVNVGEVTLWVSMERDLTQSVI
jgi:hypothetical protein